MEFSFFVLWSLLWEASMFTLLQIGVVLWTLWYLMKKPTKPLVVTETEKQKVLSEWEPEPLITSTYNTDHKILNPRIVNGFAGKRIIVDGKNCLNFATHNYLGLLENMDIYNKAIETIHKYGVGSCGPRGFYGTLDVHLKLEERIAEFMTAEEAVVYSYGFSTIASAIPAYCKRGDIIFADEMLNFASQKGIDASRSTVHYFKHNDMEDLEKLLVRELGVLKKNQKKAKRTRTFLIVEGIYMNTGEICPLPELLRLRRKYKLRMFLDESVSFGVLGKTGHGVTEYFNVDRTEVDMIIGSLDWSVASIGGFCVGSSFIIEHQRLSGQGYCFSASLPPLLTQAAIDAIDYMENTNDIFKSLNENCVYLDKGLKTLENFSSSGHELSPVRHLYIKNKTKDDGLLLDSVINFCQENGVALTRAMYLEEVERCKVKPSIRLTMSAKMSKENIDTLITTLENTKPLFCM